MKYPSTILHVTHGSIRPKLRRVSGLEKQTLTKDQADLITQQALEVFTLMCNAGQPFDQALSAVFMTGFDFGVGAAKEKMQNN